MPETRTVSDWKLAHANFAADFARAREAGFDAIADDCMKIADDSEHDFRSVTRGEEEVQEVNSDHIQRAKLRIETRLKLLAKWDPKRYGDRLQTEITGELSVKKSAADMSDEELAAIAARKQDKQSVKAPKTPANTAKPRTKRA